MLTEEEWEIIHPLLRDSIAGTESDRNDYGISFKAAFESGVGYEAALEHYEKVTGYKETNGAALWHHRLRDFGPPCASCGRPLRTPGAHWCAFCGTMKGAGEGR